MIVRNQDGREIEITGVSGDIDDPMIDKAYYVDTNEEISDEDYDYVYESYAAELSEERFQHEIGRAEYLLED